MPRLPPLHLGHGLLLKSREKSFGEPEWRLTEELSRGGRPRKVYHLNGPAVLQYAARINAKARFALVRYVYQTERAL